MPVRYYRELLNFCARAVRCHDAAADVVQEAYVRVLSAGRSGTLVSDPRALLYRTARNLMTDGHRRAEVRRHESLHELSTDDEPRIAASLQPEEACASTRYAREIVAAIDALPPRCREAFVRCRFDGQSYAEVAAAMGISPRTVETHVRIAMEACWRCAEPDDLPRGRRSAK